MKVDVKELIGKILNTPVVVETGTSGIWNYRKWSNGTAECWGVHAEMLTYYATVAGFYGYYTHADFPTGLFNAVPVVNYNAQVAQGFAWTGATLGVSATGMNLYAVGQVSGTQACIFNIHAKGKWK